MKAEARAFDEIYDRFLGVARTNREAYEMSEEEHERITGHRKYSDSESYRRSRSRRIKRRK